MNDAVDAVMRVMEAAFDPAFGEAWSRRQLSDALLMPNTHLLLSDARGGDPLGAEEAVGFALTRGAVDEEELLLIAVLPEARGRGIGRALLVRLQEEASERGIRRLFLEMREGNPAERLYGEFGFEKVGRRKNYYRRCISGPIDAITFAKRL